MSGTREGREAGVLLNAEICRALGWASMIGEEEIFWRTEAGETTGRTTPPDFSGDIALAVQVVGKMQADDDYRFTMAWGGEEAPRWYVTLNYDYNHLGANGHAMHDRKWSVSANTLPLAICLAALAALDAETQRADERSSESSSLTTPE